MGRGDSSGWRAPARNCSASSAIVSTTPGSVGSTGLTGRNRRGGAVRTSRAWLASSPYVEAALPARGRPGYLVAFVSVNLSIEYRHGSRPFRSGYCTDAISRSRKGSQTRDQGLELQNWNMEADVVVVGFGAAGVAAAVTAHDCGAEVVILEKAPEGEHGGNTRVAGQGYLNTSSTKDATAYLTALCGPYAVPEPMVRAWAEEMCRNNDWLESLGGDPQEHQHPPVGIEFPDLPGSGCVHKFHDGPTYGYSYTWKRFESLVKQRPISVLYETPGRELIQDDISKEILGIRAQRRDETINVKARRAVVLTCGGFENNQEMIRNYLPGIPYCYYFDPNIWPRAKRRSQFIRGSQIQLRFAVIFIEVPGDLDRGLDFYHLLMEALKISGLV